MCPQVVNVEESNKFWFYKLQSINRILHHMFVMATTKTKSVIEALFWIALMISQQYPKNEKMTVEGILCPRERFFPVRSIVTGQDPVCLHDSSGKSLKREKSVLTARNSGDGTCNNAGHFGGLGMGQLLPWSKVEYSIPHTFFSQVPSWFWFVQVQPHLFSGLSNCLLTKPWIRTSNIQRTNGKEISRIFVLIFRFCQRKNNNLVRDIYSLCNLHKFPGFRIKMTELSLVIVLFISTNNDWLNWLKRIIVWFGRSGSRS